MSKTLSITIPDRLHAALEEQGQRELEMDANAWLKHLLAISTSASGVHLKLELKPLPPTALPLFDAVSVPVH
jgi:hypothetical protein